MPSEHDDIATTGTPEQAAGPTASSDAVRDSSSSPDGAGLAPPKPLHRGRALTWVRHAVQVLMLCAYAFPLLAVGWGLAGAYVGTGGEFAAEVVPSDMFFWGSLSSSQLFGINLLDPYAALQAIAASKQVASAMLWALPILILFAIVRGRAFCGWVCPVNLLLEAVDWLRDKLGLKVYEMPIPRIAKVVVAAAVLVLSAATSIPLYESVNPIGALNRAILFGSTLGVWTLVAIVVAELFFGHRVWCRSVCPLGGFYQVLGTVGLVNVRINHASCIGCDKCKHACICDPGILDDAVAGTSAHVASGDCMLCGQCIDVCPTKALGVGLGAPGLKL